MLFPLNHLLVVDSVTSEVTSEVTSTTVDQSAPDVYTEHNEIDDATLLLLADNHSNADVNVADLSEINNSINELKSHIDMLYKYLQPQTITIFNFKNLKPYQSVTTVKEKVDKLFQLAGIPLHWKITLTWTQLNNNDIDSVTISMLNYHVKEKTKNVLNTFLATEYNNTVYI